MDGIVDATEYPRSLVDAAESPGNNITLLFSSDCAVAKDGNNMNAAIPGRWGERNTSSIPVKGFALPTA